MSVGNMAAVAFAWGLTFCGCKPIRARLEIVAWASADGRSFAAAAFCDCYGHYSILGQETNPRRVTLAENQKSSAKTYRFCGFAHKL